MTSAKRIGGVAIAALIATASLVPTSADARDGRFAAGAFAGFAAGALVGAAIGGWGLYPYYYGPYAGYGYGRCGIRAVWTRAALAPRPRLLLMSEVAALAMDRFTAYRAPIQK
jgi:hypothetical protein